MMAPEGMDADEHIAVISANLTRLMAEAGTTPSRLALDAKLGHTAVRDILTGKSRQPAYRTLLAIAEVLGVGVREIVGDAGFVSVAIPVVGRVGAGARVPELEVHEHTDPLYHVPCPPQLSPHDLAAVEVSGDSMAPIYQPGHVLFFRKAGETLNDIAGRPCVVEDADGCAWVKLLQPGAAPGLAHLLSLNPLAPNMLDRAVRWAARVRLALPADLIEGAAL